MLNHVSTKIALNVDVFVHCTSGQPESNIDLFSDLIHLHISNTKIFLKTIHALAGNKFPAIEEDLIILLM